MIFAHVSPTDFLNALKPAWILACGSAKRFIQKWLCFVCNFRKPLQT